VTTTLTLAACRASGPALGCRLAAAFIEMQIRSSARPGAAGCVDLNRQGKVLK